MKKTLRKAVILLGWTAVWYFAAKIINNKLLMVTPGQTATELLVLLQEPEFYQSIAGSLLRIGGGFTAGFLAAGFLAACSYRFSLVEEICEPVILLLKTIPVASFVVLLLIWWGAAFLAAAISFLVVFPNLYINTLEGLKNTDRQLLEMAQVFRLPFWNRFFYIYRPALEPFLQSGMKISLGMCWKSGVAAEVIGIAEHSIGGQLYLSKIYLNTAGVFAWTVVVVLLSLFFEKLLFWGMECFFRWQPACRQQRTAENRKPEERELEKQAEGETEKQAEGEREKQAEKETERELEKQSERETQKEPEKQSGKRRILQVREVSKTFGETRVLSQVNAVYEAGEEYVLDSPSGSGKTTYLKILAGCLKPDTGCVTGAESVAMVFQEDRLCMEYSAIKNVELITGNADTAKKALLQLLDGDALEKPCRELSGGMKRRVALVRAMEAQAQVILLDEPYTGMDEETRRRAKAYIHRKQADRIVIMATHI